MQVNKRLAVNFFRSSLEEETVFRSLVFVYVYKLFEVRFSPLLPNFWMKQAKMHLGNAKLAHYSADDNAL